MPWTFKVAAGEIWRNGKLMAKGVYSGHGDAINDSSKEAMPAHGPIPRGRWLMDGVYNSAKVGPFAIILDPAPGTNAFGRSGFRVHGDNAKGDQSASEGCVIVPRNIRDDMWQLKDHVLDVV
jgi:hypothetical protein